MKRTGLFIAIFLVVSVICVTSNHLERRQERISISELKEKLALKQNFYLQIELEGCPACAQLDKVEEELNPKTRGDITVLEIPKGQKEYARTHLKSLFPSFEFYPTIYAISNEKVKSEFNLSTLNLFAERFTDWRMNTGAINIG